MARPVDSPPIKAGEGLVDKVVQAFTGWQFATFALSAIVAYELFVIVMLLAPTGGDSFGRFAEEFKTWCFGYDPATGKSQPMYLFLMVSEPLVLGLILGGVYWKQLGLALKTPRRMIPHISSASALVVIGAIALIGMGSDAKAEGELPFPGDRIRTSHESPTINLIDHQGKTVTLDELRGRVVVLTGVYASCTFTCPMILGQAKAAIEALSEDEKREVTVVAVTMDPNKDTPEILAGMAKAQGVAAPIFRLSTGEPGVVEALLDRMGIERHRDPETGVIDHANLFLVVDRQGRIAYRLTLGERQQRWLISALKQLVAERGGVG